MDVTNPGSLEKEARSQATPHCNPEGNTENTKNGQDILIHKEWTGHSNQMKQVQGVTIGTDKVTRVW